MCANGLVCGIRQVIRALENGQVQLLCLMATDFDGDEKNVVETLCQELDVPFLNVSIFRILIGVSLLFFSR